MADLEPVKEGAGEPDNDKDDARSNRAEIDKMLEEARERFALCVEAEKENRDRALQALNFRNGEQWDPKVKRERENDPEGPRPCLVMDKLNQYVHQVVNDGRMNRPAIKVRPVGEGSDKDVAKVLEGIVRHIEDVSRASIAYDTGLEHAADGGFGYIRVITEYTDEMSFDQDIRIKRVKNRFTVYLDPEAQMPDGSDAKYGFVVEKMRRKEFVKRYPNADPLNWETDGKIYPDWLSGDWVLVAEYFRIVMKKETICLWADGSVTTKGSDEDQAYKARGIPRALGPDGEPMERETEVPKVLWSKITAQDELEKTEWLGKYIPIVRIVGNDLDIEGKSYLSGLVWGAMDAQRVHNYAQSSFVENVALAPKAPWVAARGQTEGQEEQWRDANRRSYSVLYYNPVVESVNGIDVPVPPPQRTAPPGIPVGWQAVLMDTEHAIEASMGMYKASVGAPSNEKSGKAIVAREKQSDTATFHYIDNEAMAIQHVGRIIVDLIPKVYDTKRVLRILGEDGEADEAVIDPDQEESVMEERGEDGAIKKIYNPSVGKYDVTVTVGPSFSTKRQEAASNMTQLAQAYPPIMEKAGDIIFGVMDGPGFDRIAERLKKTLPPALQDDGKNESPEVMQARQMLEAGQQAIQQQAQAVMEAHGNLQVEAAKIREEAMRVDYEKRLLAQQRAFASAIQSARDKASSAEQNAAIDKAIAEVDRMLTDAEDRMKEAALRGAADAIGHMHAELANQIGNVTSRLDTFEIAGLMPESQPEGEPALS